MELNLNKKFVNLDGTDADDKSPTLGQIVAQVLANQTRGNAIKYLDWALALHQNKPINLDDADLNTLTAVIESSEALPALSKGQILKALKPA